MGSELITWNGKKWLGAVLTALLAAGLAFVILSESAVSYLWAVGVALASFCIIWPGAGLIFLIVQSMVDFNRSFPMFFVDIGPMNLYLTDVLLFSVALGYLFRRLLERAEPGGLLSVRIPVAIYVAVMLWAAALGLLRGVDWRQGLFPLRSLSLTLLVVLVPGLINTRAMLRKMMVAVVAAALFLSFLTFTQIASGQGSINLRPQFPDATDIYPIIYLGVAQPLIVNGAYLALSFAAFYLIFRVVLRGRDVEREPEPWMIAFTVLFITALLASLSRAAVAALLGASVFLWLFILNPAGRGKVLGWAIAGVVAMVLMDFSLNQLGLTAYSPLSTLLVRFRSVFDPGAEEISYLSAWHRLGEWKIAANLAAESRYLGAGMGARVEAYNPVTLGYYELYTVHNSFIQYLLEAGMAGLMVFLWLVVALLAAGTRLFKRLSGDMELRGVAAAATGGIAFAVIQGLFGSVIQHDVRVALIFWFLVGLIIAVDKLHRLPSGGGLAADS